MICKKECKNSKQTTHTPTHTYTHTGITCHFNTSGVKGKYHLKRQRSSLSQSQSRNRGQDQLCVRCFEAAVVVVVSVVFGLVVVVVAEGFSLCQFAFVIDLFIAYKRFNCLRVRWGAQSPLGLSLPGSFRDCDFSIAFVFFSPPPRISFVFFLDLVFVSRGTCRLKGQNDAVSVATAAPLRSASICHYRYLWVTF